MSTGILAYFPDRGLANVGNNKVTAAHYSSVYDFRQAATYGVEGGAHGKASRGIAEGAVCRIRANWRAITRVHLCMPRPTSRFLSLPARQFQIPQQQQLPQIQLCLFSILVLLQARDSPITDLSSVSHDF